MQAQRIEAPAKWDMENVCPCQKVAREIIVVVGTYLQLWTNNYMLVFQKSQRDSI